MNTVSDLVRQAYTDSNIIGTGMQMTADDLQNGVVLLNRLLAQQHAKGAFHATTVAMPITFTGTASFTIGPPPDLINYPLAVTPDILVNVVPGSIQQIIFYSNNARLSSIPMSPGSYFSRGVDNVTNPYPSEFYYERTAPFATVHFMYGTPSGNGELIYEPSYINVASTTDLDQWNPDLVAYLSWQVASDLAGANRWDNAWLQTKANSALRMFKDTNRKVQSYIADGSATGRRPSGGNKFNIFNGELV